MVVVAHEHPRKELESGPLYQFIQKIDKSIAIRIVLHDGFPPVPSGHAMVDRIRKLNPDLPRHAEREAIECRKSNVKR